MSAAHTPIPETARQLELPLESLTPPLDWPQVFGRPGPSAIEIGTGNGLLLANQAARHPDWNFIGLEREGEFYWKMVRRCDREGLTNVRTRFGDAIEFIEEWIAPGSIQRVYCYFSDPWPKRRHAKHRVFNDALPPLLERILAPGGELWMKTDVGYYFNLAVTAFRARTGWRFLTIGKQPLPDVSQGEVITNFERKARETGSEIWGFRATPEIKP